METRGKELLPKIEEVVNTLQQAKKNPIHENESAVDIKEVVEGDSNVQKTGLEFDLTLPIDLPGLKPSGVRRDSVKKDIALFKKESTLSENSARSAKLKPKPIDLRGSSKQKNEGKPQSDIIYRQDREGGQKPSPLQLDVKKDTKLKSMKPKKTREEVSDAGGHSHSKLKELDPPGTMSEKQRDLNDINKRDRMAKGSAQRQEQKKESSVIGRKEKLVCETNLEKTEVAAHSDSKDESTLGGMGISEKHASVLDESKMSLKETSFGQSSSCGSLKNKEFELMPLEEDIVKKDGRHMNTLPPRRRSARLASFSDDQDKDESCQDEEEAAEAGNFHMKSGEAKMSKTSRSRRIRELGFRRHGRGVAHLDSSSEDEYVERSSRSAEKFIVEPDEERHASSKRSGHRKRSLKHDYDSLRSSGHVKRPRTLSRTGSPASTGSSASSTMTQEGQVLGQHHKAFKEVAKYSKQSASFLRGKSRSRSPTPVVVTRFNRHVKPNRRYYTSDDEIRMEGDASEEHQTGKNLIHGVKRDKRL